MIPPTRPVVRLDCFVSKHLSCAPFIAANMIAKIDATALFARTCTLQRQTHLHEKRCHKTFGSKLYCVSMCCNGLRMVSNSKQSSNAFNMNSTQLFVFGHKPHSASASFKLLEPLQEMIFLREILNKSLIATSFYT